VKTQWLTQAARWTIGAVVALAAGWTSIIGAAGGADAATEPLQVSVEAGYGGSAKEGRWYPVKVMITNPGDDLTGELAVFSEGETDNVAYAEAVDLPRGSTKTVWFTLPARPSYAGGQRLAFFEGGVERGKEVPFEQKQAKVLPLMAPADALFVGVLARDPDTLNFLTLFSQRGMQVDTTHYTIDTFPWDAAMLDGLDIVAINDAAVDTLTEAEASELRAWIARGGRLLLAGGANFAKSAALGALSPVEVTGTATTTALPSFEVAAGERLTLDSPFTVSVGSVREGETLFEENGIPLVVSTRYGSGQVTYVAYDLALQPLASWSGNPKLWERILAGVLPYGSGAKQGQPISMNGVWEMEHALDYFPQFVPPAFGSLSLLFLLYAVVVGPLLYFALKKLDRREWAWFVIPALALLTSGIIYGVGASGRGAALAQTLAIQELDGKGGATRTASSSVFVPSGGQYSLLWEGKRTVTAQRWNEGVGQGNGGAADTIVRSDADRTVATFRNVPFWSIKKAYVAEEFVPDAGAITYTVKLAGDAIEGEVANKTPYDLYEAGVLYGDQWAKIGDVPRGERRTFRLSSGGVQVSHSDLGGAVFPYNGSDERLRERALLNMYVDTLRNRSRGGAEVEPVFLGFARGDDPLFNIEGIAANATRIDLYAQPLVLDYEQDGNLIIPGGAVRPYVESSSLSYMHPYGNGTFDAGAGSFILAYRLPQRPNWSYEKVVFHGSAAATFSLELWNERKQAWEPLTGAKAELAGDRLAEAMTPDGRIRLQAASSQGGVFAFPQLAAEGRVLP